MGEGATTDGEVEYGRSIQAQGGTVATVEGEESGGCGQTFDADLSSAARHKRIRHVFIKGEFAYLATVPRRNTARMLMLGGRVFSGTVESGKLAQSFCDTTTRYQAARRCHVHNNHSKNNQSML